MGYFYKFWTIAVLLSVTLSAVKGFRFFQQAIPNGDRIPHPCIQGTLWNGVGHQSAAGGGPRNPFGLDFYANDKVWNRTLCQMDSDHDGLTNGQELGDPDCTWTVGGTPTRTSDLSHPGVCEPYDSAKCISRNSFLNCETFQCPAMNELETFKHSVKIPETRVPPQVTTYQCMPFEFPDDKAYHMVANMPNIDNWNVMHHIVIYGCTEETNFTDAELSTTYNCFMGNREGCNEFLAIWALGMDGNCFHELAGLRVGQGGIKRAILELHWNNPMSSDQYVDSSGMDFFLTPQLRPNDAGVLMIGDYNMFIPPKEEIYTVKGTCSSECTQKYMTGDLQVFAVTNHMHYLGHSALSSVVVPNTKVTYLGYDKVFDYNRPVMHTFQTPLTIKPGEQLELTCNFNSMQRNRTTKFGEGTYDEMCFAFLFYYPAQNFQSPVCVSSGPFTACQDYSQGTIVKGCNFNTFFDINIPEIGKRFSDVSDLCATNRCLKECKGYIKELLKDPCYTEEIKPFAMEFTLSIEQFEKDIRDYWLRVQSCDMEIARESVVCPPVGSGNGGDTSAAAKVSSAAVVAVVLLMIAYLI